MPNNVTRFRRLQQNQQRLDVIQGAALALAGAAIFAAPFILAWVYPAQFTRFVWGF